VTSADLTPAAEGQVALHPSGALHEEDARRGLWVFGYGSLIWNPVFDYVEQVHGRCAGVHRSFCVRSVYHRGSYQKPGLVLGLDGGGSCDGVLYRVAPKIASDVVRYLRRREQVTRVYREMYRNVEVTGGPQDGRIVRALCFVAERNHAQYINTLSLTTQAAIIRDCCGRSGRNIDYLISTLRHLEELGIDDPLLQRILNMTGCHYQK
jgi:cation transport protein ChaC